MIDCFVYKYYHMKWFALYIYNLRFSSEKNISNSERIADHNYDL